MRVKKKTLSDPGHKGNFIIRVYGIFINENNEVLLSDEYELNTYMTKFPGGGLNYGESTIDCLKRECLEELGQEIEITEHFYTTDFFQQAKFFPGYQLISIYYLARFNGDIRFKVSDKPFDLDVNKKITQSFRWVPVSLLDPDEITFPIDKKVAQLVKERFIK